MEIIAGSGRQILGLFVVFSLLGLTVWKLRGSTTPLRAIWGRALTSKRVARKGVARERALETVERLALTPQHTLHVLRLRDREMLVATHPQGCTLLDASPAHEASHDLLTRGAGA